MTLVKELEGRRTVTVGAGNHCSGALQQGEKWAQLPIPQGDVEIFSPGAGWGVSGWKITEGKHY